MRSRFWALLVVLAVGAAAYLAFEHASLVLRVASAQDQAATFEKMRQQALKASDPAHLVGYLECTVGYYPSGSKQSAGSSLDLIVEQARQSAVREIIADLRAKTGQDLGDDPQAWIDRFKRPDPGRRKPPSAVDAQR
jgi:hypothetical protein